MFTYLIYLALLFLKCYAQKQDICSLQSCSSTDPINSTIEQLCISEKGFSMRGRCCTKPSDHNDILGIDLSFCDVKILKNIFAQAPNVKILNLTNNRHLYVDNETFRGLNNLSLLSLPSKIGCPGNTTWFNASWKAWDSIKHVNHMKICFKQRSTCDFLSSHNYSCPPHSSCVNNGPGSFLCQCDPPWQGYKCLRLPSKRPIITILSASSVSATIFSVVAWITERRCVTPS